MSDYIYIPADILEEISNDAMQKGMTVRAYLNYICEKHIAEVLYCHDLGVCKNEIAVQWHPTEKLQADISTAMSKLNVSEKAIVMKCIKHYRKEKGNGS